MRVGDADVFSGHEILFVLPIALLALEFGLRGGLSSALLALVLVGGWDLHEHNAKLSVQGYVSCAIALLLLGALLGTFVDYRRRLEAEISRSFDESPDLLGVADLNGRFVRVNPAWERMLGHSVETICSRPFIDFVHPDDREATAAEAGALAEGSRDTFRFRNRYRAADGSYKLLEWSAHGVPAEGSIHAVGRDIRVQAEAEAQLANNAQLLEEKVAERTRETEAARAETLQRLARAGEYRDDDTFQHTERVGAMSAGIAAGLGFDADQIALLREAAPLHDIGKIAISDSILLKPGKLSEDERAVMQTHAEIGARLLRGSSSPVLQMATVIAASHHERWDGAGYPAALAGEAIPLVGRVVAVADVFDALTHDRPYKRAWDVEDATAEIERGAGSQFDPRVVAAFLAIQKSIGPAPSIPARLKRSPRSAVSGARLSHSAR